MKWRMRVDWDPIFHWDLASLRHSKRSQEDGWQAPSFLSDFRVEWGWASRVSLCTCISMEPTRRRTRLIGTQLIESIRIWICDQFIFNELPQQQYHSRFLFIIIKLERSYSGSSNSNWIELNWIHSTCGSSVIVENSLKIMASNLRIGARASPVVCGRSLESNSIASNRFLLPSRDISLTN